MKDLVYYYNEMDKLYRSKSDSRWVSFRIAMNWYAQHDGKRIVETGCANVPEGWGAGMSTLLFGDLCKRVNNGSHLWTVDLSKSRIAQCQKTTEAYKDFITYTVGDSVQFLSDLNVGGPIDLLYLDSYDYPYNDLVHLYGGRTSFPEGERVLSMMSEDEIVSKHGGMIKGSQEHCLKELEAALPHCHDKTMILIDDNNLPGGGKPRLAKDLLIKEGYVCLYDWQQTVWVKR